ncbi:MAG TPA: hypothetical protein VLQ90_11360 [Pyrinomonadaceae bacterium]|nr:hypothetical protein [Pyrinomonadaceae bacterium]
MILIALCAIAVAAQQPEQRAPLNDAAIAFDDKGAPGIEARVLTTVLNGSQDSPVTNLRLVINNPTANSYTYVTGLATFYDSAAVRCGEGLFKVDALAPNESAEADTPGLRLRCSPATWRIVATNLLTRANETAKPVEAPPPPVEPAVVEKPAPVNFVISIDGEQHPIQLNNPIVLKLGTRNRKIVLRNVP